MCSSCSASGVCHLIVWHSLMHVLKVFSRTHELMWLKHGCHTCWSICRCWIDQQDRRQATAHHMTREFTCHGQFMPRDHLICHKPPSATTHQPESPAESHDQVSCAGDVSVDHDLIIVWLCETDNFYFESLILPTWFWCTPVSHVHWSIRSDTCCWNARVNCAWVPARACTRRHSRASWWYNCFNNCSTRGQSTDGLTGSVFCLLIHHYSAHASLRQLHMNNWSWRPFSP